MLALTLLTGRARDPPLPGQGVTFERPVFSRRSDAVDGVTHAQALLALTILTGRARDPPLPGQGTTLRRVLPTPKLVLVANPHLKFASEIGVKG